MSDDTRRVSDTWSDRSDPQELLRMATAFHEAGHAVMALTLGRIVHKVSIVPGRSQFGGTRLGVCQMQNGRSAASKNLLEDEVLILFAGMVAEAHFTGDYCELGASQDLRQVERLLCDRSSSQSQYERRRRRMLDKTAHLLGDQSHSAAIETIARELMEKTTISGRAVRHHFNQAMNQFS
jgi:ATP-dependent Zn protease